MANCDSNCCIVSIATPTTINIDVPPNAIFRFVNLKNIGNIAIIAKNIPPNHVNFEIIEDKYSVVGFPALIPGMNPPFFLIVADTSAGLNVA